MASVANLLDLPLAVVSGSVALGFGAPFFAAAQAELDRSCRLDFSRGTRILPGGLGADGPLIGAARVALRQARNGCCRCWWYCVSAVYGHNAGTHRQSATRPVRP